jgi:hypothetical protein
MVSNDNNKCKQELGVDEESVTAVKRWWLDNEDDDESSEEAEMEPEEVPMEESMNQPESFEEKFV